MGTQRYPTVRSSFLSFKFASLIDVKKIHLLLRLDAKNLKKSPLTKGGLQIQLWPIKTFRQGTL